MNEKLQEEQTRKRVYEENEVAPKKQSRLSLKNNHSSLISMLTEKKKNSSIFDDIYNSQSSWNSQGKEEERGEEEMKKDDVSPVIVKDDTISQITVNDPLSPILANENQNQSHHPSQHFSDEIIDITDNQDDILTLSDDSLELSDPLPMPSQITTPTTTLSKDPRINSIVLFKSLETLTFKEYQSMDDIGMSIAFLLILDFALHYIFGLHTFRGFQKNVIMDSLNHRDILVLMPTGGGKSLCYQLAACLERGLTIVVSPLISLLQDQVYIIPLYCSINRFSRYYHYLVVVFLLLIWVLDKYRNR